MANGYRADKVNVAHPGAPRRVASASRWDSPSGFVSRIVRVSNEKNSATFFIERKLTRVENFTDSNVNSFLEYFSLARFYPKLIHSLRIYHG